MEFSSMVFLWIFLPIVMIGNYILKGNRWKNIFLLMASLFFYAWGEPVYVILMIFSIMINWLFGLAIDRFNKHKRMIIVICIIFNLTMLGYFKYYNFLISTLNRIIGSEIFAYREIELPIGISFFTFQALSYIIDVYRGECNVQKKMLNLALYISLFPQLIAGPIVRYADIDEQINKRYVSMEKIAWGIRRFLYGLTKKVIISNCMAEVADQIFAMNISGISTITAWIGAIAYTLQIYYDFSGYSDMAIGLGKMCGFEFLENFNYPYLSKTIQEFWQRWHISLGTWFREYVYIPLGGNRKGKARTYVNLLVVFILTGMWHGASWHYVLWGVYHGVLQIVERIGLSKVLEKSKIVSRIYCLVAVVVGWVIFRADSMSYGLQYIKRLFWVEKLSDIKALELNELLTLHTIVIMIIALIGCGIIQINLKKYVNIHEKWKGSIVELLFLVTMTLYSLCMLATGTYNPFIYFRF